MAAPHDPLSASVPGQLSAGAWIESAGLLTRAQGGDRGALAELLARHHERLRRIVRVRLGPSLRAFVDSADVVQETYRAVLAGIEHVDPGREGEFLAWLAQAATNRIRDEHSRLHAGRRDVAREVPLAESRGPSPSPAARLLDGAPSPSEQAFLSEVRDQLDAALDELVDDQREVILLRDYSGVPWESIAARLASPSVAAARQLHQRAWIRLRQIVEPRLRRPT